MDAVLNHLWQSSLFAGAAGALLLLLRNHAARVRYWLWFAASIKFLIPFSLLVALGSQFEWRTAAAPVPLHVLQLVQPFETGEAPLPAAPEPGPSRPIPLPAILAALWAIGSLTLLCRWLRRWSRIRATLRSATPIDLGVRVKTLSSPAIFEPGVFGIFRPALLLPRGIEAQLTPSQLESILTHEQAHICRRDNLTSVTHMLVETLFWFHPLVWWIGARLIAERENACDQEVLSQGAHPEDYSEAILKICELYLESPLPCAAGVTGANLKQRIEAIMTNHQPLRLSAVKKSILAAAAAVAVGAPLVIGVVNAPPLVAQSILLTTQPRPAFEVASVKPTTQRRSPRLDASSYSDAAGLASFVAMAYGLDFCATKAGSGEDCALLAGLPGWANPAPRDTSNLFEIQAKLPPDAHISSGLTPMQLRGGAAPPLSLMLQVLLEDRFHLKAHRETRELSVYALATAKGGPKLKAAGAQQLVDAVDGTKIEHHGFAAFEPVPNVPGRRRIAFQSSTIEQMASGLAPFFDRPVLDRTGLKGQYDLSFEYDVDPEAPTVRAMGVISSGLTCSSLSAGLEASGLKCESIKAPVDVLVVDHVERPSEN